MDSWILTKEPESLLYLTLQCPPHFRLAFTWNPAMKSPSNHNGRADKDDFALLKSSWHFILMNTTPT